MILFRPGERRIWDKLRALNRLLHPGETQASLLIRLARRELVRLKRHGKDKYGEQLKSLVQVEYEDIHGLSKKKKRVQKITDIEAANGHGPKPVEERLGNGGG